jgi:RNA polymerase sigma-70 factor (ECF subfamily)
MDGFSSPAPAQAHLADTVAALCQRYDNWFRDVLRKRYGDRADDLANESYLRAAAKEIVGEIEHPRAFLLTIADNLARDGARQRQREQKRHIESASLSGRSTDAPQEHTLTLKQIVLALPPELRDVFLLTRIQGLSYREVAALRNISELTVKNRVRRAIEKTSAAMRD